MSVVGDDDALVKVEACGLCRTDHEEYTGALAGGFAFVPGHETVGIIEAIGPRAAQRWEVGAGDRVAVEVFQSCRSCPACLAGEYRRCMRHGLADMYGFIPVDRKPGVWGGYSEYQYLAPDSMVLPVPRRARSGGRHIVQPAGSWDPLGCNNARHRTRLRGGGVGARHPWAVRCGRGLGISADDLLGVRDWSAHDAFDARERAVLVATDEVVRDGSISAATWATCERELGPDPAVLIELVTWRMISSLLNSLEVPLEDGVESWPPDGRAPRQTIR